jgi:hypothetical protein
MSQEVLEEWLIEAIQALGGSAAILEICQWVWAEKEEELRNAGDLFFTWQYDIRWAASRLQKKGILLGTDESRRGIWELKREMI